MFEAGVLFSADMDGGGCFPVDNLLKYDFGCVNVKLFLGDKSNSEF